jgi:hypothetical protein
VDEALALDQRHEPKSDRSVASLAAIARSGLLHGLFTALLRAGVFVFAQISLLPVILAYSLDKQKLTFGC